MSTASDHDERCKCVDCRKARARYRYELRRQNDEIKGTQRCSHCGEYGHNARTCEDLLSLSNDKR